MSVFRTGLSYLFKWSSIGLFLLLIVSFILKMTNSDGIIPNSWYGYTIGAAVLFYAFGYSIEPSIETDSDGNAIPKRK